MASVGMLAAEARFTRTQIWLRDVAAAAARGEADGDAVANAREEAYALLTAFAAAVVEMPVRSISNAHFDR